MALAWQNFYTNLPSHNVSPDVSQTIIMEEILYKIPQQHFMRISSLKYIHGRNNTHNCLVTTEILVYLKLKADGNYGRNATQN